MRQQPQDRLTLSLPLLKEEEALETHFDSRNSLVTIERLFTKLLEFGVSGITCGKEGLSRRMPLSAQSFSVHGIATKTLGKINSSEWALKQFAVYVS